MRRPLELVIADLLGEFLPPGNFLFQTPLAVYLGNCIGDSEMKSGATHPFLTPPPPYKCRQLFSNKRAKKNPISVYSVRNTILS